MHKNDTATSIKIDKSSNKNENEKLIRTLYSACERAENVHFHFWLFHSRPGSF